jgi:predicted HAD superfamily Cof-like phosphohydrolase
MKLSDRLRMMNEKYELPVNARPTLVGEDQISSFHNILAEEVDEIEEIPFVGSQDPADLKLLESLGLEHKGAVEEIHVLTMLADLIADVIVYCGSQSHKHGIPIEKVLHLVMDSNDSKLGADGKPIKDGRGKFLKGPNFQRPEPKIMELLKRCQEA